MRGGDDKGVKGFGFGGWSSGLKVRVSGFELWVEGVGS
jgi:hypothetical protein